MEQYQVSYALCYNEFIFNTDIATLKKTQKTQTLIFFSMSIGMEV